jgi:hypothetical protein
MVKVLSHNVPNGAEKNQNISDNNRSQAGHLQPRVLPTAQH